MIIVQVAATTRAAMVSEEEVEPMVSMVRDTAIVKEAMVSSKEEEAIRAMDRVVLVKEDVELGRET